MNQKNQGKISVQQGEKKGDEITWGAVSGEKDFQYLGEAKNAFEGLDWDEAEKICGRELDDSFAILIKLLHNDEARWVEIEERIILYFVEKEQESLKQDKNS